MVTDANEKALGGGEPAFSPRRASGTAGRSDRFKKFIKKNGAGFIFALPVTLGLIFFTAYPLLSSLYYSFFREYTVLRDPEGFDLFYNLNRMFNDPEWIKAVTNTVIYTVVNVPLTMVLSFMLAVFLNSKVKGIGVYRVLIYLPCTMSVVVSGVAWRLLVDVDFGWMNQILNAVGLPSYSFLDEASSSMPTMIFVGLWGLGGSMVLWLSQLKNISPELYEAADLDGASSVRKFFFITIPMCTPMIFYNLVMSVIASFQVFAQAATLVQGGGKENSLLFYVTKIYSEYNTCVSQGTMGYACAMAWVLFVIVACFTAIIFKSSKWVFYGGEE